MKMASDYETQRSYESPLKDFVSELSDLDQEIGGNENNGLISSESIKSNEYNRYPYINDSDYAKYFAPETYNFKQFLIGSCRFISSIYGITRMESYKAYIKNSVKKDEYGNFIIKLPLSNEKNDGGTWHKINLSVYQNQRTIYGLNPQILHKENKDENQDSGNGIVALAMAIGEELTGRTNFDIYRLEGGNSSEVFLDGKTIKNISLKELVESDTDNNKLIDINELKSILGQKNTIVIARVKENNDGSFETITRNKGEKSNHEITITKIIKEGNVEYIQYYDPNFSELRKLTVDDFQKKCFGYSVFCAMDKKNKCNMSERDKPHLNEIYRNTPGMVVENTGSPNATLRNLRGDFVTYEDSGKTIVESFGKRSEIINSDYLRDELEGKIKVEFSGGNLKAGKVSLGDPYWIIKFSDSSVCMNIDKNKLLEIYMREINEIYMREINEKYKVNLYLPKIANFMHRMMHDYIDTEAWNKQNSSPFSINLLGNLVFDDDPNNVNLDKINSSERKNYEREWEERKKSEKIPFKKDLVCLRDRTELGINDNETKREIVRVLNSMVNEKKFHK